jgi:hypothetical protein
MSILYKFDSFVNGCGTAGKLFQNKGSTGLLVQ